MSAGADPNTPLDAEQIREAIKPGAPRAVRAGLSSEDLVALNEEIAGMARAGLPLDQGLAELSREMGRGRLQQVTQQLAADLKAGCTLPQALERQKERVPPYYSALLAAGIRSGRIGDVLGTLTLYARSLADFRSTLVSALCYPAIVMVLGLGLVVVVSVVALPEFVGLFGTLRMTLPPVTRLLLYLGDHPLTAVALPAVLVILVPLTLWWLLRSGQRGRIWLARFVYSLPLVGTLIRSARLAAFADLLGILVDQSIPLPEAFQLAAAASSDPLLTEGARRIQQELNQGTPLAEALQQKRLVPELVVWMTRFGEKQGTLGPALHQLAVMYRRQADLRASLLRTVLPPLLIIGLAGILVSLFVFGLLAPMQDLLDRLGGLGGGSSRR